MLVLDKIKAFFKRCGKGIIRLSEQEAKGAEKKEAEPPETEASEKKENESYSK